MGVETKERKEGERMSARGGGRKRTPEKGTSLWDAAAPQFLEAERGRAAFRALRLKQRARKGDEEATSSPRPSLAAQEGSVGAAVPSPIGEWRQRPLAPSEGADCGALRAFLSLAFTPPPPGKASGMTPARLRTAARVT